MFKTCVSSHSTPMCADKSVRVVFSQLTDFAVIGFVYWPHTSYFINHPTVKSQTHSFLSLFSLK